MQGIERDALWGRIEQIVALTLVAVHPRILLTYRCCLTEEQLQTHDSSKCFQVCVDTLQVRSCYVFHDLLNTCIRSLDQTDNVSIKLVAGPKIEFVVVRRSSLTGRVLCISQMLGFDIMLDAKGKALLLEVNTHPSFSWDTSVDATIKRPAMAGCMAIVCGSTLINAVLSFLSTHEADVSRTDPFLSLSRQNIIFCIADFL